jgi:very-short-patch-repair endonuclease
MALRLLNKQGLKFRRQAAIGHFIGDFVDYGRKLVVELDGSQHGEPKGQAVDTRRSRWLASQGYTVLRFWNGDVDQNLEGVVETIFEQASRLEETSRPSSSAEATPPLTPPHEGEGNDRNHPHE